MGTRKMLETAFADMATVGDGGCCPQKNATSISRWLG